MSSRDPLRRFAYRVRSSISRLRKHRVAPPDVWHAEDPVLRPSGGPEIDVTVATRPCARGYEWFCEQPRSDREVAHRVRSSISRLRKHRVAPLEV